MWPKFNSYLGSESRYAVGTREFLDACILTISEGRCLILSKYLEFCIIFVSWFVTKCKRGFLFPIHNILCQLFVLCNCDKLGMNLP